MAENMELGLAYVVMLIPNGIQAVKDIGLCLAQNCTEAVFRGFMI